MLVTSACKIQCAIIHPNTLDFCIIIAERDRKTIDLLHDKQLFE